jgi:hypothetical protein
MTKANWAVAACAMLLLAGTAGAADDALTCLSKRSKATGKFQHCVQNWLAVCYKGGACPYEKLSKCRENYQKAWDKVATLNVAPCSGSRWVDNMDGTVTDHLTDLVWEQKTDDGGTHDWDNKYTWSTASPWVGSGTAFTSFLAGLNSGGGFAGANDWRLPTFAELMTILNQAYPCTTLPCVDSAFGSYTQSDGYWSSTTNAYRPSEAWRVGFGTSYVGSDVKDLNSYIRAVRGGS